MDSVVLYGPGGASPIQIGSWMKAEPGPNYGDAGLMQANVIKNPYSEGHLGLSSPAVRKMQIPMILGSVSETGGLQGVEALIRRNAVEGGYVDVQPQGVPSSEAVRFDIIAGRWNPNYSIHHQRHTRRDGVLELDTKAYGYWPTWITLASDSGLESPQTAMTIPVASLVGDVNPLFRLSIQATSASSYETFHGSYMTDFLAFGFKSHPSFIHFWSAASLTPVATGASVFGHHRAPASQGMIAVSLDDQWTHFATLDIPSALEPAYRGNHRVYAWLAHLPSQDQCLEVRGAVISDAFSAWNKPAEGLPGIATVYPVFGASSIPVPTGYQLVDLGVHSFPFSGSGQQHPLDFQLWVRNQGAGYPGYVSTPLIELAGIALIPQDTISGVVNGWHMPTYSATYGDGVRLWVDGPAGDVRFDKQDSTLDSQQPVYQALQYRGPVTPRMSPSYLGVAFVVGARKVGLDSGHVANYVNRPYTKAWYYRFPYGASYGVPFLSSASWGATADVFASASIGAPGPLQQGMMWVQGNSGAVASQVFRASVYTMAVWAKMATANATIQLALTIGSPGSYQMHAIGVYQNKVSMFKHVAGNMLDNVVGDTITADGDWHLLALTYYGASAYLNAYFDGSYLGSYVASPAAVGTMPMWIGRSPSGAIHGWYGGLGEVVMLPGTALTQDAILQMYNSGYSPTNTPSAPLTRMSRTFVTSAIMFRPQFMFLKGV